LRTEIFLPGRDEDAAGQDKESMHYSMGLGAKKRWGFDLFLIPGLLILGLDTQYTPAQVTLINYYHHHPFIHIQVTCPLGINPFKKAESEAL
jgi:hypothetical protein